MMNQKKEIPIIILCGGMGTRLKEETEFKPKPMVEIGGKPILWHIMKIYAHYGYKNFILALGFKGDYIKDYFIKQKYYESDFVLVCNVASEPHNSDIKYLRIDPHSKEVPYNWSRKDF